MREPIKEKACTSEIFLPHAVKLIKSDKNISSLPSIKAHSIFSGMLRPSSHLPLLDKVFLRSLDISILTAP
jgi:hypothetical protein